MTKKLDRNESRGQIATTDEARSVGRPTKYEPWMLRAATYVAKWGATVPEIAETLDVSDTTIEQWLRDDDEFSRAVKAAREWSDEEVARSLRKRAIGYTTETGTHVPGHPVSQIFWLKNRQPDKWRDRVEVERTGDIDQPKLDAQGVIDGLVALANEHPITAIPLRNLLEEALRRLPNPALTSN